jgi:hypothetical protein
MRSQTQEMNISRTTVEKSCQRMDQIAENRHFIFQQEGAPAHNIKRTQDWLQENLTEVWVKEIWPPSYPD